MKKEVMEEKIREIKNNIEFNQRKVDRFTSELEVWESLYSKGAYDE